MTIITEQTPTTQHIDEAIYRKAAQHACTSHGEDTVITIEPTANFPGDDRCIVTVHCGYCNGQVEQRGVLPVAQAMQAVASFAVEVAERSEQRRSTYAERAAA